MVPAGDRRGDVVQPLAHSFAHSQERGHMDNMAASTSQPGKSSHPHQKPGKIHSKPTGGDLKPENLGVTLAPRGIWAEGENRGGWGEASEWRNLILYLFFFPT